MHPLPLARFRLTGADRVRYLNGQVTNQVANLEPDHARYAVVTNHKGQLEGELHLAAIASDPEALYLDAPAALRESLFTRLGRYIIADDAQLTDITDDWIAFHLLELNVESRQALDDIPHQLIANPRFGSPGHDLWIPHEAKDRVQALDLPFPTPPELESLRIAQGIPMWDHELIQGILPPEARLQDRAIHYEKGCYIGQEIISRMRTVGKTNRLLCLLKGGQQAETNPIELPLPLHLPEAPDKPIGTLTSIAPHAPDAEEFLALAYVKTQHIQEGTPLHSLHSLRFILCPFPSSTTHP